MLQFPSYSLFYTIFGCFKSTSNDKIVMLTGNTTTDFLTDARFTRQTTFFTDTHYTTPLKKISFTLIKSFLQSVQTSISQVLWQCLIYCVLIILTRRLHFGQMPVLSEPNWILIFMHKPPKQTPLKNFHLQKNIRRTKNFVLKKIKKLLILNISKQDSIVLIRLYRTIE